MGFRHVTNMSDFEARSLATNLGISSSEPIASLPGEILRRTVAILDIPPDAWTAPFTSGQIRSTVSDDLTFFPSTVLIPSRSDIPVVQDVLDGLRGQQITYLLILRTLYTIPWADLTKAFNCIWNGPSWVHRVKPDGNVESLIYGWPYRPLDQAEVVEMWEAQTLYPKDMEGMRSALALLEAKKDYLCQGVAFDHMASVPTYQMEPGLGDFEEVMERIERKDGANAEIKLVKI